MIAEEALGIEFSWRALTVCFFFLSSLLPFSLEDLASTCFFNFNDHSVLQLLGVQFQNLEMRGVAMDLCCSIKIRWRVGEVVE